MYICVAAAPSLCISSVWYRFATVGSCVLHSDAPHVLVMTRQRALQICHLAVFESLVKEAWVACCAMFEP